MAVKGAVGVVSGALGNNNNTRFIINNQMLGGIVTGSAGAPSGSYGAGAYLHLPLLDRAQVNDKERQVYLSASFEGASGSIIQALNAAMFVAQQGATVTFDEVKDAIAAADAAVDFNDQNITGVGAITIESIAGNWTNAGRVVADGGTFTEVILTTADINGGTVDGATIATSDVTVGSGKTLDVSAGTLTTSAAQKAAIVAGVGADVDIGANDFRAGTITADGLTATRVVFAGTDGVLSSDADMVFVGDKLTVAKLGAFEAAGAINFASQAMTNVDINSGAVDGAIIGAASAAAGTFTTVTATTSLTANRITSSVLTGSAAGGALSGHFGNLTILGTNHAGTAHRFGLEVTGGLLQVTQGAVANV